MLIEQRLWQKMRCQWQAYSVISIPFIVTYFVSQLIVSRFIREETTDIFTGTIIPFVSLILMLLVFQILQIIWLRIVNSGPNKTMEQAIDITENGITYWHKGNADFIAWDNYAGYQQKDNKGMPTIALLRHTDDAITFPSNTFSTKQLITLFTCLDHVEHDRSHDKTE